MTHERSTLTPAWRTTEDCTGVFNYSNPTGLIDPVHAHHTHIETSSSPTDTSWLFVASWWFVDETSANECGPYATRDEAKEALRVYCKTQLLGKQL